MRCKTFLFLLPLWLGLVWLAYGQGSSFDRLSDADRQEFSTRFRREVWPLLSRGGKDGCVGCHHGKHASGLHLSGDSDTDFRTLLREGFLLKDDPGSVLASVTRKDGRRRMPPGNRPAWTAAEIDLLRAFVRDVDSRQKP